LDKHHVGGRRADHGPKHEPGQNLIRQESRRYSTTKMQSRSPHTRMGDPFLHQICLDEDGPVTEVLTLTDSGGQTISLNSTQLVMIKEHGDRTLLVHTRGEVMVLQSHDAILKALSLHQTGSAASRSEHQIELH
jgi:hypothetical protein